MGVVRPGERPSELNSVYDTLAHTAVVKELRAELRLLQRTVGDQPYETEIDRVYDFAWSRAAERALAANIMKVR